MEVNEGLSLRDYFAAAALTGLLAAEASPEIERESFEQTAKSAFRQADAMLEVREAKT
jgi:hypothetical protein